MAPVVCCFEFDRGCWAHSSLDQAELGSLRLDYLQELPPSGHESGVSCDGYGSARRVYGTHTGVTCAAVEGYTQLVLQQDGRMGAVKCLSESESRCIQPERAIYVTAHTQTVSTAQWAWLWCVALCAPRFDGNVGHYLAMREACQLFPRPRLLDAALVLPLLDRGKGGIWRSAVHNDSAASLEQSVRGELAALGSQVVQARAAGRAVAVRVWSRCSPAGSERTWPCRLGLSR